MNIQTKYFGETEVNNNGIITFESGIPGFLEEKKFVLLPMADTPFVILQSVATEQVAFVLVDPFLYISDYEFDLPDEWLEKLQIKEEKDVTVFVILTVKEPFVNTTANLQAPIIINQNNKLGKQFIMNDGGYTTRHLIFTKLTPERQGE